MTEKELINKIKGLSEIKPKTGWAVLTKTRILGQEINKERSFVSAFPLFRPALAAFTAFVILFGLFGFSQNSLPGDFLYSIKKMAERSQRVFVSEQERPQVSLQLVNRRLEELTRIAEGNQVQKLAPAINEFQASVSEANKNISKMTAITPDIVDEVKKIEKEAEKISRTYGVVIESEELESLRKIAGLPDKTEILSDKTEVERLIFDLEEMTLAQQQEEVLNQMKELAEKGEYSAALELFLAEFNQAESDDKDENSGQDKDNGEDDNEDEEEKEQKEKEE